MLIQILGIVAVLVTILTALIFDWPSKVRQAVLRWKGQRPVAVSNERPGVERLYPVETVNLDSDPTREGVRTIVLHLYNHADHRRHVLLTADTEVVGVKGAQLVPRGFWIPGNDGLNVVMTLQAPDYAWADSPVIRLKLRGSTNAKEKIRWRGVVNPLPYDLGPRPLIAYGH